MSKLYTNSVVVCSCSNHSVDDLTKSNTKDIFNNCHQLADLLFCASCQSQKCKQRCCSFDIECKYCPNCLFDYTDSNDIVCSKNCFSCPLCDSTLSISVNDDVSPEGKSGKVFKFKCLHCRYSYKTSVITKPKSLINIIKSERKKRDTTNFQPLYLKFQDGYNDMVMLHHLNNQSAKKLSQRTKATKHQRDKSLSENNILTRMKTMELTNIQKDAFKEIDLLKQKISKNASVELDEEEDTGNITLTASMDKSNELINLDRQSKLNLSPLHNINSLTSQGKHRGLFPIPKQLRAKKSYRCDSCSTPMVIPTPDPLSIKFVTKWNAVDYLPTLTISGLANKPYPTSLRLNRSEPFIINLMNPLDYELNVSIFILSELSHDFVRSGNSTEEFVAQVTLPLTNLMVPALQSKSQNDDLKHLIKQIPTPLLSHKTKLSRAELMMRMGRQNATNRSVSPDDSIDIESSMIEKGVNWVSIPFSVVVNSKIATSQRADSISIKIPFYITVEAKLPEEMKQGGSSKRGLKYGFWNIADLGSLSIDSAS